MLEKRENYKNLQNGRKEKFERVVSEMRANEVLRRKEQKLDQQRYLAQLERKEQERKSKQENQFQKDIQNIVKKQAKQDLVAEKQKYENALINQRLEQAYSMQAEKERLRT